MSMSDTLGDMLTRIRNGQTTNKKVVDAPASRFRKNVLEVLKREGFIRNYEEKETKPGINFFEIELKYYNGKPVITEIKRVSKNSLLVIPVLKDSSDSSEEEFFSWSITALTAKTLEGWEDLFRKNDYQSFYSVFNINLNIN